jgi:hypothetical protein
MKDLHPLFIRKVQTAPDPFLIFVLCTQLTEPFGCIPMMPTNTERRMLSLQALLNPPSSGQSVAGFRQSNLVLAASSTSLPTAASRDTIDVSPSEKARMPAQPQGSINFPPFEDIEDVSYREMCRFRVSPFGKIRQSCQHIPYNSSKKDFFEKTGRESIEGKGLSSERKQF